MNKVVQFVTREEYEAMNRTLTDAANSIPKIERIVKKEFDRKEVVNAFNDAFELIGGVSRLAVWALENQTEFYKLYAKLLPSGTQVDVNASGEVVFKHVLPPSKLDANTGDQNVGSSVQSKGSD